MHSVLHCLLEALIFQRLSHVCHPGALPAELTNLVALLYHISERFTTIICERSEASCLLQLQCLRASFASAAEKIFSVLFTLFSVLLPYIARPQKVAKCCIKVLHFMLHFSTRRAVTRLRARRTSQDWYTRSQSYGY